MEESVDFMFLVENIYKLSTDPLSQASEDLSIDRLISMLCSQPKFYDFELHYPSKREDLAAKIKDKLEDKLSVL